MATTLRVGSKGEEVKALQASLNANGANLAVDGDFGQQTLKAVQAFQRARGLSVDGVVGNNTWSSLTKAPTSTSTGTPPSTTQSGGTTPQGPSFMDLIQAKLLEQSGIISSANTDLENNINNAIAGIKESTQLSSKAVESAYNREIGYTADAANTALTEGRSMQSGGVMNIGALRELTKTTDKQLNDLEQRKQELILQNDAAGASKIAELQMKSLEFRSTAMQQVFSNLLGLGNFAMEADKQKLARESQSFQERSAVASLGMQYGVDVLPGDTIDTVINKINATGFVSQKNALELTKIKSEINKNNAEAQRVIDGNKNTSISDGATAVLAARWNTLISSGQTIDTSKELQNILGNYGTPEQQAKFYEAVANDAVSKAKDQVTKATTQTQPVKPYTLGDVSLDLTGTLGNILAGTAGFITGKQSDMVYDYKTKKLVPRKK